MNRAFMPTVLGSALIGLSGLLASTLAWAADTTIDFEGTAGGGALETTFAALGIVFDQFEGAPSAVKVAPSVASSGNTVAAILCQQPSRHISTKSAVTGHLIALDSGHE